MKFVTFSWFIFALIPVTPAFFPSQALAQLPARFYLKSLSGGSAVPLIVESISGNTNPFDPAHNVTAGAIHRPILLGSIRTLAGRSTR